MKSDITVKMTRTQWTDLRGHLLPRGSACEQGAFALTAFHPSTNGGTFEIAEIIPLGADDYVAQYDDYLELRDSTRARLIKLAHDRDASLMEAHSHLGKFPACFSPSDWAGLSEFVPHVRWRLRAKPYAAIVVTESGFDGLAWATASKTPAVIAALSIDAIVTFSTGLSKRYLKGNPYGQV